MTQGSNTTCFSTEACLKNRISGKPSPCYLDHDLVTMLGVPPPEHFGKAVAADQLHYLKWPKPPANQITFHRHPQLM
jgi:hypothetical protein